MKFITGIIYCAGMKPAIFPVLFLMLCFGIKAQALKAMAPDSPPLVELHGEAAPTGVLIDIWEKQIAPALGEKIEWISWSTPSRILWQFENNEIDIHIGISKNPERLKVVHFSSKPIVTLKWYMIVLNENKTGEKVSAGDLDGKTISAFSSTILPPFLSENRHRYKILTTSSEVASMQSLDQLINKRVWAIFYGSQFPVIAHAAERKLCSKLDLMEIPSVGAVSYYVGFSKQMPEAKRKDIEQKVEKVFKNIDLMKVVRDSIIKKDPACARLLP